MVEIDLVHSNDEMIARARKKGQKTEVSRKRKIEFALLDQFDGVQSVDFDEIRVSTGGVVVIKIQDEVSNGMENLVTHVSLDGY
jgi:hypothetical protein